MKRTKRNFEKILAFVVAYLAPGYLTLGFHKFGDWYRKNGFYKFSKGQVIKLKNRRLFGYGVNPRGVIAEMDDAAGCYLVNMTSYHGADGFEWAKTGRLPANAQVSQEQKRHSKWNIENHFCVES